MESSKSKHDADPNLHLGQDKKKRIALTVIACFCLVPCAPPPASSQNIKITDYDIPISEGHRLMLNGSFRHTEDDEEFEDYRYTGVAIGSRLESFYNSLPYAWTVDLRGNWLGSKQYDGPMKFRESASFVGSIHEYATEASIFFASGSIESEWYHHYHRPDVNVGLSMGLGRYIDATPLAKAIRINEFLQTENILRGYLSGETLLELASIIDRKAEYQYRYGDTYPVWWHGDMEKVIVSREPLPGGSIGALGMLRIAEVLEREAIRPRAYGWNLEAGINVPVASGRYSNPGDAQPFVAASFEQPLGLKHQVSAESRALTKPGDDFGDYFEIDASVTYSYEISNRIDLVITETYSNLRRMRRYHFGRIEQTLRKNKVELFLHYYLENRVSVNCTGRLEHRLSRDYSDRYADRGHVSKPARLWHVHLTVGYHLF